MAKKSEMILQSDINMKGLADLHRYCNKANPVIHEARADVDDKSHNSSDSKMNSNSRRSKNSADQTNLFASTANSVQLINNDDFQRACHPQLQYLCETIINSKNSDKNTELLAEVDRIAFILHACKVVFCKSGKDRTGMIVTYDQSRTLGERYHCSNDANNVLLRADNMRMFGCRLDIAEKNIGRRVYSINKFQCQFLPTIYRPPSSVCEDILKKDNS